VKGVCDIVFGNATELRLGNLEARRDWGHAKDYVEAMWMMLQQDEPDDFVCATGISHSIKDLCEYVFGKFDLDYRDYVKIDERYFRPDEIHDLRGDSTKAKNILGWSPKYSFHQMLDEMIDNERHYVYNVPKR
jgi:GDPmannose 4,6-dehydratase